MFDLVPSGTVGVFEMVHRILEKIKGEKWMLPLELWEDSEGNHRLVRGGVEVDIDQIFPTQESVDVFDRARGILRDALRKGELVLEVEDDTGRKRAITLIYLDSGAGLETMVTGHFTGPGAGDRQPIVCFADRGMFNEWLASKFPDDMEEPKTAPIISSKSFRRDKVREWYKSNVAEWKLGDPIPSEEKDLTDAKAKFGNRVTRVFIRELRHELAPAEWNVSTIGRKSKPPSK